MRELEGKYLKKVDYSRLNDMQAIEERVGKFAVIEDEPLSEGHRTQVQEPAGG